MNRRPLGFLMLSLLFLFNPSTFSQKPIASSKILKFERVSQNELNQVAQKLANTDLQLYTHRRYKLTNEGRARLDKETPLRALFLMRKREFMKPLPGGFYDDKQDNLVFFGSSPGSQKQTIPYSLTFTLNGEAILAFDLNGDGVVDGMLARNKGGSIWGLMNGLSSLFWQCMDARFQTGALGPEMGVFGAAASCWRRGRGSSNQGREGGTTPGGADAPTEFEAFIDSLQNPNCDVVNFGDDVTADPGTPIWEERLHLWGAKQMAQEAAHRAREANNHLAAADYEEARVHARQALYYLDRSRDEALSEADRHSAYLQYRSERQGYTEARARAERHGGESYIRELPRRPTPERGTGAGVPPSPPLPRPNTRRPADPDESEDPRCLGRRTRLKQLGILGLAFNRQFCGDDDAITCLERASDAIRDATQGRCHTETGPDDSRKLVCEKKDAEPDPLEPNHPEPVPGPLDGPPRAFDITPERRVNYGFVETTPLGAVLAVLCKAGGGNLCPGEEGLKAPRKNR